MCRKKSVCCREGKRNGRLTGAAETSRAFAKWHGLQRKNFNWACPVGKSGLPQNEQLVRTPEPPLPQRKEPSVQITRSLCGRETRSARVTPWREREGSDREHGEERLSFTMKNGGFQGRGEGKPIEPPQEKA